MFYSKSTGGFYDAAIHGDNIPADAVEITAEKHTSLLDAQSRGKLISADEFGYPEAIDPPGPTYEQIIVSLTADIQAHLDATAHQFGYDDMKTAVTYADEPAVPKFQQEGQALRAWRSLVWEAVYAELALHQPGEPIPTGEQLIEKLPAFIL
ncbi:hypothetical protein [Aeromonas caviae]|uniref:hypothetical protein n=1 Tax=Aeromonas caviae TaxID=648 RepID=UPI00227E08C6|nr:hypothetical protein [Aeromonas caviae]MCY9814479.1 hypothetical protein [Aeromonas caviae]